MDEIWKPIARLSAEASNIGRVRAVWRNQIRIRHGYLNDNGYEIISINNRRYRVHVLVMEAFVGPKPFKMDVNHKDGVKSNNHIDNLEYLTRSDNHRHAFKLGLSKSPFQKKGEDRWQAKLTEAEVTTLRKDFASGISRRFLASQYGISYYTVWDITERRSWKHI